MAGAQAAPVIYRCPEITDYLVDIDPSLPYLEHEVIGFTPDGSVSYPRMMRHQFFRFCDQGFNWAKVSPGDVPEPVRAAIAGLV
jgi:hypothetical protein